MGIGVYPFGDDCLLHVDMYHQYCPFLTEFQSKLKAGENFMYTWRLGLGSDFPSLYSYYLASPLNLLLLLWPKGAVIEFIDFITIFKICFASFSFFCFLDGSYALKEKTGKWRVELYLPALVFSMAYSFCGFVAAYSWDIMWMDAVALLPLTVLGLKKLVKEKKPGLYFAMLAYSIWSNYYISIMICYFLIFAFAYYFLGQKEGRLKAIGRFSLYSILAGGVGAAVILPEIAMLSHSGSAASGFPKEMKWYFPTWGGFSRMSAMAESYTSVDHWPNLYSGVFAIFFLFLYVMNKRVPWKDKILKMGMVIFFFISFSNSYLDFIWHGFDFPDQLPGRQAFLFSFLVLIMGFECYRKRAGNKIWHGVVAFVVSEILLFISGYALDSAVTEEYAILITALFLAMYFILFVSEKMAKGEKKKLVREFAGLIAALELIINFAVVGLYTTSRSAYLDNWKDYKAVLEQTKNDDSFYRVEDTNRKTKNDDCFLGYSSGTEFSSLMNLDVSHFYQSMYMEGGKNFYCHNGATPLLGAMLSVKYDLSKNPNEQNPMKKVVASSGNTYLYENKYVLPLAYVVPESALENMEFLSSTKVANLNNLAVSLGATSDMIERVNPLVTVEVGKTSFVAPADGYYYFTTLNCASDSLDVSNSNGNKWHYSKTTHRYLLSTGYARMGDVITVSNSKEEEIGICVYQLDENAVKSAYDTLSSSKWKETKKTETSVEGTIDVKTPGRLVFSIPNDEGWSLCVDGKKVEKESFCDAFIAYDIGVGKHEIALTYQTPMLYIGIGISLGSLLMFGLLWWIQKRGKRKHEKENG